MPNPYGAQSVSGRLFQRRVLCYILTPVDTKTFKTALETMNEETLTHFISRFADTLKLGMIKRKSVPVAKAAIDKGMSMALNKLLPDLPDSSLNRLANYYRPFIVEKPE